MLKTYGMHICAYESIIVEILDSSVWYCRPTSGVSGT